MGQWKEVDGPKESEVSYTAYPGPRNSTQSLLKKKESHLLILPNLNNISSNVKLCLLVNIAK